MFELENKHLQAKTLYVCFMNITPQGRNHIFAMTLLLSLTINSSVRKQKKKDLNNTHKSRRHLSKISICINYVLNPFIFNGYLSNICYSI